jgi:hypothetical protein
MASISDGVTTANFITLHGADIIPPGETVEVIVTPGVDGAALRLLGSRGEPFTLTSVADFTSAANAAAGIVAYRNLQGNIVTIVDDHGQSWTNYTVLKVSPVRRKQVVTPSGGLSGGAHLVWAQWELMALGG